MNARRPHRLARTEEDNETLRFLWGEAVSTLRALRTMIDASPQEANPLLIRLRARHWGALTALFAVNENTLDLSPAQAAADPRLELGLSQTHRGTLLTALQATLDRIVTRLEPVPNVARPETDLWPPFFLLVDALRADNQSLAAAMADQLSGLDHNYSATWWRKRAQVHLLLSELPPGTPV